MSHPPTAPDTTAPEPAAPEPAALESGPPRTPPSTPPSTPQEAQPTPSPPGPTWPRRLVPLGAGIVGAAALPGWRVGVGWLVLAAAATGAVGAVALARPHRHAAVAATRQSKVDYGWRLGAGVAAAALVSMAAIRSAGWLVALCLVTALLLSSYALVGGTTWRGLVRGGFALPLAVIPSAARSLSELRRRPDSQPGTSETPLPWRPARAAVSLVATAVLLLVFGALFWSADPAFRDLIRGWMLQISWWEALRSGLGFLLVLGLTQGALLVRARRRSTITVAAAPRRGRLGASDWTVPVGLLVLLFGVFVWVQVTVLFGGQDYVLRPGGPDYAHYARGGFVQLIWVTVLTLGVLAGLGAWARRDSAPERLLLRTLGGLLCVLTLVIVTSALKRLGLYATAYGFSRPRLFGYLTELWLGLIVAIVIIAGVRLRAAWLPRACACAAVALLLGLAAINPEALMARTHIGRLDYGFRVDGGFLRELSADAIDEIDRLDEPQRSCILLRLDSELATPDPWSGRNLAREHARARLRQQPPICGRLLPADR